MRLKADYQQLNPDHPHEGKSLYTYGTVVHVLREMSLQIHEYPEPQLKTVRLVYVSQCLLIVRYTQTLPL